MLPFYFLSVATTLIMGLVLAFFDKSKNGDEPADNEVRYPILRDSTFLFLITVFSGFTAVLKVLSPVAPNIIIIGDFIPVIAGLSGTIVFLQRYLESRPEPKTLPEFFHIFKTYDEIVGYLCLTSSILHLLFYRAWFL